MLYIVETEPASSNTQTQEEAKIHGKKNDQKKKNKTDKLVIVQMPKLHMYYDE